MGPGGLKREEGDRFAISRKPRTCQAAGSDGKSRSRAGRTTSQRAIPRTRRPRFLAWLRSNGSLRQLPDLTCGPPSAGLRTLRSGDVAGPRPLLPAAPAACDVSRRILPLSSNLVPRVGRTRSGGCRLLRCLNLFCKGNVFCNFLRLQMKPLNCAHFLIRVKTQAALPVVRVFPCWAFC